MKLRHLLLAALPAALLAACGGSSGSSTPANTGTVNLLVSDAASEDWATIGVKIASIALVPKGGGAPVTVFTAPTPAPRVNLVQLDQLGEILGNVPVPVGTYSKAVLTLAANPGDVELTASANPSLGFAGTAGAAVPPDHIQNQNAQGAAGAKTVTVPVTLDSPLVVTSSGSNAHDLEFDLSHPAFLVAHFANGDTQPTWAVNFRGPVHHHPIRRISHLVLRHVYGQITAVASDARSMTIEKLHPRHPASNPETPVDAGQSLTVMADATNGTIIYDLDAHRTYRAEKDFSKLAADTSKYVRVAARYQDDGSLWAVRVWVSSSFAPVWVSPEGHVLGVDAAGGKLVVENEDAEPVTVTVDAATDFFFRTPEKAQSDANAIGTGPALLANLERGFKVHVDVVDALASPLVARSVDIEIARFDGYVTAADASGFTYHRHFDRGTGDYTVTLPYLSASSPNGDDASGNPITGFDWWYLTFPNLADTGTGAIGDFVNAVGGAVDQKVWGETYATWNDPAHPNGWSARFAVLVPTAAPLSTASTGVTAGASGATFSMTEPATATTPAATVTVDLSTVPGSSALVYQVDREGAIVTVSPVDVSTADGLAALTANLVAGTEVKVYGAPEASGALKAYVLFYYTGSTPKI